MRIIKVYDGTRYLAVFGSEEKDTSNNRIFHCISLKSGVTYFSHNDARIKIDSYSLPLVFNKNKNNYYYNTFVFLENFSYKLSKSNDNK